jgi:DNA (cytosine-5)-methyltransferase 1
MAGYEVTGADINHQAHYPFDFIQGDALSIDLSGFDLIWASPPCQAFTAYRRRKGHVKPMENLIPKVREKLKASDAKWIIENIPGAPLENPVQLCGSSFGLDVRRHRIFETNFPVSTPDCDHSWQAPRFPQATNRKNKRRTVEVGAWRIPIETQRQAMGISWMTLKELSQAIPPVYAEYLARRGMVTSRW